MFGTSCYIYRFPVAQDYLCKAKLVRFHAEAPGDPANETPLDKQKLF
jgi:hypothetical protein